MYRCGVTVLYGVVLWFGVSVTVWCGVTLHCGGTVWHKGVVERYGVPVWCNATEDRCGRYDTYTADKVHKPAAMVYP